MKLALVIAAVGIIQCSILVQEATGYNILFYHGVATASHRSAIWPLAEKLADLGHNITYMFPIVKEKRVGFHPNVEEILPSKMLELSKTYVADFDINIRLENRVDEWLQTVFAFQVRMCEAFYDSPEIQEWMSRPNLQYDLAFIDASFGECFYGMVHKLKIPKHVVFIPFMCGLVYDAYGLVHESSTFPDPFFDYKPEMSLVDRTWNTLSSMIWRYNILQGFKNLEPVIKEKLNIPDMPSLTEFEKNTSLVLHNSHIVEEYPVSLPPMYVSYSGLNCKINRNNHSELPVPLPKEIAAFLEDTDSFVYVSLGSAVDAGKMPAAFRNKFFNTFKAFPKVKFLWRWSGSDIPNEIPENALLSYWFPQLDILRHPKLKVFVTQAGRASTQEALCYGVPLVQIPVFADQTHNANRLESLGAGVHLNLNSLTEEGLTNGIDEVLHKPKYKESMMKLSKLFKDRPIDALDNVLYWTEYILRHDDTSQLLRPLGIHQTWYQRRLIDVYGFLFLLFASVVIGCVVVITVIFKLALKMLYTFKLKTE